MQKKLAFVVVLLALVFTIPVSAAWAERISGGMSYGSRGEMTVTLSAWDNGDDTFGGEGQYYSPQSGDSFHLEVKKVCTGEYSGQPYVIAVGPVKLQDGTVYEQEYAGIAVLEGGEAGDRIRVPQFYTLDAAFAFCEAGNSTWPVTVIDGNFNIRSK